MVKKCQNKVMLKDALSNQILLADGALALSFLACFMALAACLYQCDMAEEFPDGFSAWTLDKHFKTDEQHYLALSALAFLHLLWVVLLYEATITTREVKQVCKKLLSDSKVRACEKRETRKGREGRSDDAA